MQELIKNIKQIEYGFKHIIEAGNVILKDKTKNHIDIAIKFLSDESYQVRMLATYILGQPSPHNSKALELLESKVAEDENWRVQEMLAKAFDYYCKTIGYENSLPIIKKWLQSENINVNRAVVEGLRVWSNRPYFTDNVKEAIALISENKFNDSEYLRKSIGNALRDIRKKHKDLVDAEILSWDLENKKLLYIHKLVCK